MLRLPSLLSVFVFTFTLVVAGLAAFAVVGLDGFTEPAGGTETVAHLSPSNPSRSDGPVSQASVAERADRGGFEGLLRRIAVRAGGAQGEG